MFIFTRPPQTAAATWKAPHLFISALRSPLSPEETEHERDKMLLWRRVAASCLGMHDNQCVRVCVCILNSSETHSGAAVHKAPRDLQHVCVLFELQQVPLQLLLVPGHLAELHLQPLKLLLKGTAESTRHMRVFKHQCCLRGWNPSVLSP